MQLTHIVLLTPLVTALTTVGCVPPTKGAETAPTAVTFSYSPPSRATPNSAGIAFAMVNAQYAPNDQVGQIPVLVDFSRHLSSDLTQALSARGFTTRGPFASHDEMTFPDKQSTDLVLEPNLAVSLVVSSLTPHEKINLLGPNYLIYSGTVSVGGSVSLRVNESLSNERMWVKNIDIPATSVPWQAARKYSMQAGPPPVGVLLDDPGFSGPVNKQLAVVYQQIMQTAWTYLDANEMTVVKQQSQEVRRRWVVTSH